MTLAPHILAADESDLLWKVLFFLVAGIIWAASQLVGWLNGKKDKTLPPSRPKRQPTQYAPPTTAELPSQRPPPLQRRQQQTPSPQRTPQVPRKSKPRPTPVAQPVPQAKYVAQRAAAVVRSTATTAAAPPPEGDDALPRRQMLDALLRPRNLRKAFVVTELLGPPVALRSDERLK